MAVVLTGFLLFAGVGSGLAPRLAARLAAGRPSAIQLAVAGIVVLSLCYLWLLPPVFAALIDLADGARILIALALIAPLAFFMGMPFPLGLTRVQAAAPDLVAWAWGVNGCASVLSALLATLIAMTFGFSVVLVAAAVLYAGAAAVFSRDD